MIESDTITFEGITCTLTIERPAQNIVVVRISGTDAGEFGEAPLKELEKDFTNKNLIELFVDARNVRGASIEVSGLWAHWMSANKEHFSMINMLTGSRFIQLTADFVRRYASLGEVMRIYNEPADFDEAIARAQDLK